VEKTDPFPRRLWRALASFRFTLAAVVLLMVLVVLCTLAQTRMGAHEAVQLYMRSLLVRARIPPLHTALPVFPGGVLVGLALAVNLAAALCQRIAFTWNRAGLWMAHAGLLLLIAGEGSVGLFQVETRMALREGQAVGYTEDPRNLELAVTLTEDHGRGQACIIPASLLGRSEVLEIPGTPLTLRIKRTYGNASLAARAPSDPPPLATAGVGTDVAVLDAGRGQGQPAALLEPMIAGQGCGTWLVSPEIGVLQTFAHGGWTYGLGLRPQRHDLPYTMTLRSFTHEVYPGTDIPRSFSSLVRLSNPAKGEERDVLIRMNQPLRYEGRTFYQASYGEDGRLSVLQVVQNPGWRLPYLACALVIPGLLLHFGRELCRTWRRGGRA